MFCSRRGEKLWLKGRQRREGKIATHFQFVRGLHGLVVVTSRNPVSKTAQKNRVSHSGAKAEYHRWLPNVGSDHSEILGDHSKSWWVFFVIVMTKDSCELTFTCDVIGTSHIFVCGFLTALSNMDALGWCESFTIAASCGEMGLWPKH